MKKVVVLFAIVLAVLAVLIVAIVSNSNDAATPNKPAMSQADALDEIARMKKRITVRAPTPREATLEDTESLSLKDELPDISKYPLKVTGQAQVVIEICSSPEKAGEDTANEGWLNNVARKFNDARMKLGNGQSVAVSVRSVSSGEAADYIISGKYMPDAYSPSNEFWGQMIAANNVQIELVEKRLVGNLAGILLRKSKVEEFAQQYGEITVASVVQATIEGNLTMAYTNPLTSSTGLNFLVSTMHSFDSQDLLSPKAVERFEAFQRKIKVVAPTTIELKRSAKIGSLDCLVLESQPYLNDVEFGLKTDFVFVPFGMRHDSPVYAVGFPSDERKEALRLFLDYCLTADSQKMASSNMFNQEVAEGSNGSKFTVSLDPRYVSDLPDFSGKSVASARGVWKTKKDGGKPVAAAFVVDVSGSMNDYSRLRNLQRSLLNTMQYINPKNQIGIVGYSSDVYMYLPIAEFDIDQQSRFKGAVEDLMAGGGTATNDGILVAAEELMRIKATTPDCRLLLFVLTDGDQNEGYDFGQVRPIIESLAIPTYTIGYTVETDELTDRLKEIAGMHEGSYTNADTQDIVLKLRDLFNSQL